VPLGFRGPETPTVRTGPLITLAPGFPYAIAFFGGAWSEQALLGFAYAFEGATHVRAGAKARAYDAAVAKTGLEDVVGK
jgi:amidase